MNEWDGSGTKQSRASASVSAGGTSTLVDISGRRRIKWIMVFTDYQNMQFKIYVDGNMLYLEPHTTSYSFSPGDIYSLYGGKNVGSNVILREFDTSGLDFAVEVNIELICLSSFKVEAYNGDSSAHNAYVTVLYEVIP